MMPLNLADLVSQWKSVPPTPISQIWRWGQFLSYQFPASYIPKWSNWCKLNPVHNSYSTRFIMNRPPTFLCMFLFIEQSNFFSCEVRVLLWSYLLRIKTRLDILRQPVNLLRIRVAFNSLVWKTRVPTRALLLLLIFNFAKQQGMRHEICWQIEPHLLKFSKCFSPCSQNIPNDQMKI